MASELKISILIVQRFLMSDKLNKLVMSIYDIEVVDNNLLPEERLNHTFFISRIRANVEITVATIPQSINQSPPWIVAEWCNCLFTYEFRHTLGYLY